jgi:hypothetical protein
MIESMRFTRVLSIERAIACRFIHDKHNSGVALAKFGRDAECRASRK